MKRLSEKLGQPSEPAPFIAWFYEFQKYHDPEISRTWEYHYPIPGKPYPSLQIGYLPDDCNTSPPKRGK